MDSLHIVIPTLNRKDLLLELLESLDAQHHEFTKLLIIDNGKQNLDIKHLNLHTKTIIHVPNKNLGVASSWNYGIKLFKDEAQQILFLNDDIVLFHDQLEKLKKLKLTKWLNIGPYFWSVFLLNKDCWNHFLSVDKHVFDENIYPAYFEDNDFYYRVHLYNNSIEQNIKELEPNIKRNSMTIKKDSSLNDRFNSNQQYYIKKWGGSPGREQYKKPFNK